MTETHARLDRFLNSKDVTAITGWSRQTLWREVRAGRFPAAVPTSPHRVGWLESEVARWQEARIERRDNPEWKKKGGGRPPKSQKAKCVPKATKPWQIARAEQGERQPT